MATPITTASAGIDLPPDLQAELRAFDAAGRDVSLYELLGVSPDVDGATIRRTYLERSRRYHPDAWYRKSVGEFGPLLSRAFQKLSAAYQILSDEDARAQYDQKLKQRLSQREREAMERRALSREEEERRQRERRERLLRTKGFARIGAAHKLYEEALELALKAARELDPRRAEIGQKLVDLEREAARSRSQLAFRSAREHEDKGEFEPALKIYAQAAQMDTTNASAAAGAARCAYALGDVKQASSFAARAVEAAPTDVEMRFFLARAFFELGLKVKARAELTRVLELKKDHEEARALLKRV
jgi:curved DNA-binding protein CbpA